MADFDLFSQDIAGNWSRFVFWNAFLKRFVVLENDMDYTYLYENHEISVWTPSGPSEHFRPKSVEFSHLIQCGSWQVDKDSAIQPKPLPCPPQHRTSFVNAPEEICVCSRVHPSLDWSFPLHFLFVKSFSVLFLPGNEWHSHFSRKEKKMKNNRINLNKKRNEESLETELSFQKEWHTEMKKIGGKTGGGLKNRLSNGDRGRLGKAIVRLAVPPTLPTITITTAATAIATIILRTVPGSVRGHVASATTVRQVLHRPGAEILQERQLNQIGTVRRGRRRLIHHLQICGGVFPRRRRGVHLPVVRAIVVRFYPAGGEESVHRFPGPEQRPCTLVQDLRQHRQLVLPR